MEIVARQPEQPTSRPAIITTHTPPKTRFPLQETLSESFPQPDRSRLLKNTGSKNQRASLGSIRPLRTKISFPIRWSRR
jgi:hypothetical protein